MSTIDQWIRKVSLIVTTIDISKVDYSQGPPDLAHAPRKGIDLSDFHIKFQVMQNDEQSPSNSFIRVFNLSDKTADLIRNEYTGVTLQAGYENGNFGIIFQGDIKQFRRGRVSATDTYLDILAADGDLGYNYGYSATTLEAGNTSVQSQATEIAKGMQFPIQHMPESGTVTGLEATGGVLPRGKVLFGMGRALMRTCARTMGATWSIQDGKIVVLPLTGYLPTDAVELNVGSGLIGMVEQTDNGICATCLLNPKLVIGGLVKIDNAAINQTFQTDKSFLIPYNQWKGVQILATVADDGFYRLYVVEHLGDNRGNEWYSKLTCLKFDKSSNTCLAFG